MNLKLTGNPFLNIENPKPWGPGSFEIALPLVQATNIRPGMRILEVGDGSGKIATTIAKNWNVSVITLEPWAQNNEIQIYVAEQGVENQVLQMKIKAQSLLFVDNTFNVIISIGSFEMIAD
ncbi:class I SAM-dependent methyltransferase [Neobacillus pocheonensis]|uniref:Class I SAM-dependent methyltransferase n=1 Tax=Neobacillus pocheonensis TaxID=363869 RepID=A0ABT0WGM3_9BACI|nr:class I SAM-dependent methyltransferase [Neobacillus pocheonensis]